MVLKHQPGEDGHTTGTPGSQIRGNGPLSEGRMGAHAERMAMLAEANEHFSRREFTEAGKKYGMLTNAVFASKGKDLALEEEDYRILLDSGRYYTFAAAQALEGSPGAATLWKNAGTCYDAMAKAFIMQYAENADRANPYGTVIDFSYIFGQYSQKSVYPLFYGASGGENPNLFIEAARVFAHTGRAENSERCWAYGLKWNEAMFSAKQGGGDIPEGAMPAHAKLLDEAARSTLSQPIAEMAAHFLTEVYVEPTGKEGGWVHAMELLAGLAKLAKEKSPDKEDAFLGKAKSICISGIEQRESELSKSRDKNDYEGKVTQIRLAERLVRLYDWAAQNLTAGYADRRLDNLSLIMNLAKELKMESVARQYEEAYAQLGGKSGTHAGLEKIFSSIVALPEWMAKIDAELAGLRNTVKGLQEDIERLKKGGEQ